ncbi:hypothetical protein A2U01_0000799 [Trifolium medium]|uniref:Uncharacterized protein n=1 Tax=Trifolium medium TaxID=97028 RepID=A0A392LYJ1_9FABA|nr:hypothetical protein [Trifolium medium]
MTNPSLRELKRKIKDILGRKRKLDADKYFKVYMQECLKATDVPPIDFGDPAEGGGRGGGGEGKESEDISNSEALRKHELSSDEREWKSADAKDDLSLSVWRL